MAMQMLEPDCNWQILKSTWKKLKIFSTLDFTLTSKYIEHETMCDKLLTVVHDTWHGWLKAVSQALQAFCV